MPPHKPLMGYDHEWPPEKMRRVPLQWKLESLCIKLLETCCEEQMKLIYKNKYSQSYYGYAKGV